MVNKKLMDIADRLGRERLTKEESSQEKIQSHTIKNPKDYILLPARTNGPSCSHYPKTLVSMNINYHNLDWEEAHYELHKNGESMLTPGQYVDFLGILWMGMAHDGNEEAIPRDRLRKILKGVLKPPNIAAEWLNIKFGTNGKQLTWSNYGVNSNGELKATNTYLLEDYEKLNSLGISLDEWIEDANGVGLPRAYISIGKMNYIPPAAGKVAAFGSIYDTENILNCDMDPDEKGQSSKVRGSLKW